MKKINVLDCTLRDGGYCNLWNFGKNNIEFIISKLVDSNIDTIECGFLTKRTTYDSNFSLFNSIQQAEQFIKNPKKSSFALMINYGEISIDDIPDYQGGPIDTLRVAFHKKDVDNALDLCKSLCGKGYKIFIQAMVSLSYTDDEFISLIEKTNKICPQAFYIVDSFGVMKITDLSHFINIAQAHLNDDIILGFHSHNNMQLSFSNAQFFCSHTDRKEIIVDSSIMGMGRGAGNLNTELFTEYLNETNNTAYILTPLLQTIDEVVSVFHQKNFWGYTLPNYLSAKHNLHPNYAHFLDDKKTLSIKDIDIIFNSFSSDKKFNYDENYISHLYLQYMSTNASTNNIEKLKNALFGKEIILIAPGKNAELENHKILSLISENVKVISINHNYKSYKADYVFISNKRKAIDFNKVTTSCLIATSNVALDNIDIVVDYKSLLNDTPYVKDNAGLMAVKLLINVGVKKIYLAGFDGYSNVFSENYSQGNESVIYKKSIIDNLNKGTSKVLTEFAQKVEIEFLTSTKYIINKTSNQ